MNDKKSRVGLFSWLITIVTAHVVAQPALAQTAAAPARATAAEESLEEVVVTGSRVSNGNSAPTPVTVVSAEQLLAVQPGTISSALTNLPVFANSQTQANGPGGGNGTGANASAGGVNIRNLNPLRVLVLYDGHRVTPVSNNGFTSTDLIPQMLLSRVDVVTGGASAVYGSDAVSGVVNFITDRNFTGLKFKAQGGISQNYDDQIVDVGVAFGTSLFGGRGHFEASLEYLDDEGIFTQLTRHFGKKAYALEPSVPGSTAPAGSAANPYKLYTDVRLANVSFGGRINSGPLRGQNFTTNGVLSPFVNGAPTGSANFQIGGDGAWWRNVSMQSALRTKQAFTRFDFDITDNVHGYATATGIHNRNQSVRDFTALSNVTLSSRNAFLPAAIQSLLPATGTNSTFTLSKLPEQFGDNELVFLTKQYFMSTGLEGKLGDGYTWETSYAHSESRLNQQNHNNYNNQKLSAALDAVINPATGQPVCYSTLNNPLVNPGCVPLNLFGPTSESPEAIRYIFDSTNAWTRTSLDDLTASISGAPVNSWAGPITMALSAEARRLKMRIRTDSVAGTPADCTLLRFNCSAATATRAATALRAITTGPRSEVSQTVKELAYEFDMPLLKDQPLAQSLNLNGAVRLTDYNTSGNATTWKAGLSWRLNDSLKLRAARSRDIRAPNLNDLFAAPSISTFVQTDTLTGATLNGVPNQQGGNPDLKPEVGNTQTGGFIYEPQWLPGFSVSLDGYDIKISDAIFNLQGTDPAVQRACTASGGTSNYCSLLTRPFPVTNTTTANNITAFRSVPINIASLHTYGADFELNYATSLLGRPFSVRGLMTWQPHLKLVTPGLVDIDVGGAAFSNQQGIGATPALRLTTFASYSPFNNFVTSMTVRWRSKLKWDADPTVVYVDPRVPTFTTVGLNLAYTLEQGKAKSEIYFNVQNLFNAEQPPFANGSNGIQTPGTQGGRVAIDSAIGRYYTLGVRIGL